MKTLETLEQEAKQARENLIATIELGAPAALLADDMILAAVTMVTYQFALGMQEVSGDEQSMEIYIEDLVKAKLRRNEEKASENYLHGDGSGEALKDKNVNQGICDESLDIVDYKVASGEDNNAKLAELQGK